MGNRAIYPSRSLSADRSLRLTRLHGAASSDKKRALDEIANGLAIPDDKNPTIVGVLCGAVCAVMTRRDLAAFFFPYLLLIHLQSLAWPQV